MEKDVDLKVSATFEKIKDYSVADVRFTKVKIKMMHLGLNLNNSIFNKDVVDEAIPSLYNTPILAYVEKNDEGMDDFSDHRQELSIEDNQIKITYKCIPFGVISESCNPRYETCVADDGVERTYLVVDGLVWNKLEHSDIFSRDVIKDASMELSSNYSGHFDKDNHFIFTKMEFDGICGLGNGVQPAMKGASIEVNFALDEIKSKLEQFNSFFNNQSSNDVDNTNNSEEGGNTLAEEIKNNEIAEDVVEEVIVDETVENEVENTDTEETIDENMSSESEVENAETETVDEIVATEFSVTYLQKREALQNALSGSVEKDENGEVVSGVNYWVSDFDDTYVYVEKYTWGNGNSDTEHGRFSYSFDDANIVATINGDFEKMIVTWVTVEENERLNAERTEYERLVNFEKDILATNRKNEVQAVFDKFDERLADVEGYSDLKANYGDMSIEDIEDKCFAMVGKITTKFSAKKKNDSVVKLDFEVSEPDTKDDGYGGILSSRYSN